MAASPSAGVTTTFSPGTEPMPRSSALEHQPPHAAGGLWDGVGELVSITGSEPFRLDDTAQQVIVESGEVDVFSVDLDDDCPTGRRVHLFRCAAPALLSGAKAAMSGHGVGLLGVAVSEARLRRVSIEDFLAAARAPERVAEARRLAVHWLEHLGVGAAPPTRPRGAIAAPESGCLTLEPGSVLEASCEGTWIRLQDGRASLFGEAEELGVSPESGWLPLPTAVWIVAGTRTTVEIAPLATVLQDSDTITAMRRAASLGMRAIEVRRRAIERAALAETTAEAQSSRDELAAALASAVSLFGRRVPHTVVSSSYLDTVLAACHEIGWYAGLEFRRPPARRIDQCRDPVDEIGRASHVRYREIALTGDWWRHDNGPLLAFRSGDAERAPRPVALLPTSPRRYRLIDPSAGTSVPVDATIAASLQPTGYMFYRPLPESDVTATTLLRHAFTRNSGEVLMILGMALLGGLIAMATPVMTAVVFGTIVPAGEKSQLLQVALGLAIASLASAAFGLTKDFAILRFEGRADNGLEGALWDRLLALPVDFFRGYAAGDLANRVNGVNTIRQLLTSATLNAFLTGVFSIFSLGMIFYYSWKLALLSVLLAAIAVVVELLTGWAQLGSQRESANRAGRLEALVLQQLTAVGKLRVAGAESRAFARWMTEYLDKTRFDIRARLIQNGSITFSAFYTIFSTILVFGVYYFFLDQSLATGDFLGFNSAFGQYMHAQLGAAAALVTLVRTIPLFERAQPILRALPETHSGRGDPGLLRGEIEMRDVTFRYAAGLRPILDGVSFRIKPGEYVAFVGSTGAGKTSLVKLLLGFESPEMGEVMFDGKDVRGLDPVALRRQLGIVLQDGRLMAGDIFHNIVGSTRRDEEDAWRAAEAAVIADEIRALPMGMHTYIAEGGRNISGGQRQRLLLAHALVHDPAILILDEATSALDNASQAQVIESLNKLRVTRVVVAHRLTTIQGADRILVLDQGRIAQEGTYEELLAGDGPFRELALRQLA
jgi:NHLM bacteriocin system ABC transporter ATP-binding protein